MSAKNYHSFIKFSFNNTCVNIKYTSKSRHIVLVMVTQNHSLVLTDHDDQFLYKQILV